MDDGNAKHDLEQASRSVLQMLKKPLVVLLNLLKKAGIGLVKGAIKLTRSAKKYVHRNFNHSMKAIQNDGPTRECIASPSMTYEEMKIYVEKSKEAGIEVAVKEMKPDYEFRKRKSEFSKNRMIRHETKIKELQKLKHRYRFSKKLSNHYQKKIDEQKEAIKKDNEAHSEKRYTCYCNKSRVSFMNEILEEIRKMRLEKMKNGTMEDINKDGVVDEKDIGDLKSRNMNLTPDEMTQTNEDYGDALFSEFHHDFSTQKVTKEEYCAMRESMFDLHCHAAKTTADGHVMIAVINEDLNEYLKYAPKSPIREYGSKGGIDIQSIQDNEQLQHLKVNNDQEWQAVKTKYAGADYIASHNSDGSISFLIREKDTEVVMTQAQKKTTTDSLLDEAKRMSKEQDALNKGTVYQSMDSMTNHVEDSMEGVDL